MGDVLRPDAPGHAERYLAVGTVRKPHGIKGELLVEVETDHPDAMFQPGRVLRVGTATGEPTGAMLTVERSRPFKDGLLLRVREHPSRTAATDELRGSSLLIPEAEAAPLAEGEVFYHQLVGMRVVTAEGEVGPIAEVRTIGGADLLVVRQEDGREVLIPFVKDIVWRIDPAAAEIEIDPPEGLLEL